MDGLIPNWSYVTSLRPTVYIEPTLTIAPAPSVVSKQPQVAKQPTDEEEEESMSNRREVGSIHRPSSNINYDNNGSSNHLFAAEALTLVTQPDPTLVAQDCQISREYGVDTSTTSGIVDVVTIHKNEEDGCGGGRNNMTGGLLVDPATIDYAESLLVPESELDIVVVTGDGERELLFDDNGTMMNNNEILSLSTAATEPHTNQEQT